MTKVLARSARSTSLIVYTAPITLFALPALQGTIPLPITAVSSVSLCNSALQLPSSLFVKSADISTILRSALLALRVITHKKMAVVFVQLLCLSAVNVAARVSVMLAKAVTTFPRTGSACSATAASKTAVHAARRAYASNAKQATT